MFSGKFLFYIMSIGLSNKATKIYIELIFASIEEMSIFFIVAVSLVVVF